MVGKKKEGPNPKRSPEKDHSIFQIQITKLSSKSISMKKNAHKFLLILLLLGFMPACEVEENETVYDDSLIIVHSSGDKYAIVSPSTGNVLYEVTPENLNQQISARVLSYNSEKALLLAKEPANSYVKVIYSCDMKTGENLTQVTSEQMWDIQSMDASRTSPTIVFHGHPADGGALESNLFKINVDGTGIQQLTQNRELVDGIELWWPYFPSVSPNGQKIAFRGNMRTPDPGGYWWGQSIIVMNADGSQKKIIYNEPDSNSGDHKDISWTRDGKFLVFLTTEGNSTPAQRAKVLRVEDGHIIDITQSLMVDGLYPTNLCTSPLDNIILFNKHQPGGGDLHEIAYEISDTDDFIITGSCQLKCKVENGGLQFGAPKTQLYVANQ